MVSDVTVIIVLTAHGIISAAKSVPFASLFNLLILPMQEELQLKYRCPKSLSLAADVTQLASLTGAHSL